MATKLEQAKAKLRAEGTTIKAWAKAKGFSIHSVRAVIAGHNKGHYGEAHRIAVALGLKEATE
ncbi:hypothetical protein [Roseovarius mucosus]|uniref:hypothetical protein n=1 Tax=Roseovarius mucosus TaxID=215743 RepID=UPI003F6F5DE0